MATATQNPAVVIPETYTLTITADEAAALRRIFRRVGGMPSTTPRGHIDAINAALMSAGAGLGGVEFEDEDLQGRLFFRES